MYARNTNGTILGSLFTLGSVTSDGGGVQCAFGGSWTITDSDFEQNQAGNLGGAMHLVNIDASIEGCRIVGNAALGAGGGASTFDNSAGSIGFRSCLFRDNDGGSGGGAIDARAGTASIEATEFCTNAPTQLQGSIVDLGGNTFGYDCNSNGICDLEETDANGNGYADECEIAFGDFNLDGLVNAADITVVLNGWAGSGATNGDLNGDGVVNAADITVLLNNWGPTPFDGE